MSICSDCPLRRACGATEDRAAEAPVARIIVFGYGGFSLIQFLLTIGAFEEFDGRNSKRSAENSETNAWPQEWFDSPAAANDPVASGARASAREAVVC